MDRAKNTMISAAKDLCDLAMRVQRPTKVDELATNMKTAKSLGDSVSPRESCRIEFSGTTGVGQRVMATQANYIMDEADSGCGTHRTGATTLPLPYVRPGKLDALPRTEGWIAVCVPADQHPPVALRVPDSDAQTERVFFAVSYDAASAGNLRRIDQAPYRYTTTAPSDPVRPQSHLDIVLARKKDAGGNRISNSRNGRRRSSTSCGC
jgi:hypothetical protein